MSQESPGFSHGECQDSSECFSLRDLAINGNDLIQIGFYPGPKMGKYCPHYWKTLLMGISKTRERVYFNLHGVI